jgi:hypothetical protein
MKWNTDEASASSVFHLKPKSMSFTKLSKLSLFLLKLKDKQAYKQYKYAKQVDEMPVIPLVDNSKKAFVNFKHSGNLGDIIYALPSMYALADNLVQTNDKHPLGNVILNNKSVALLAPLLLAQPQFNSLEIYQENQPIDYDLDLFRTMPLHFDKGHISRWYFNVFATTYDLGKPWITVKPDASINNKIVIARSVRYNAPSVDYSFLSSYNNLIFIGLPEEYELMKSKIPQLEYRKTTDFLSLASTIAGAKLFIGNQSFPYSLAEAIKIPRILESYYLSPNVIPEGANAYEFSFQPQFEFLVKQLLQNVTSP